MIKWVRWWQQEFHQSVNHFLYIKKWNLVLTTLFKMLNINLCTLGVAWKKCINWSVWNFFPSSVEIFSFLNTVWKEIPNTTICTFPHAVSYLKWVLFILKNDRKTWQFWKRNDDAVFALNGYNSHKQNKKAGKFEFISVWLF